MAAEGFFSGIGHFLFDAHVEDAVMSNSANWLGGRVILTQVSDFPS